MPQMNNTIEILKVLDKSNCRKCSEATCLAFAVSVAQGQRSLNECVSIEDDAIKRFGGEVSDRPSPDMADEEVLDQLKGTIRTIDLATSAKRLGATFKNNRLTLKVCGKNFSVDPEGNFYSEIHTNSYLTQPLLNYILEGKGVEPSGQWMPFRELKGGKEWGRFFEHRCEKTMKRVADTYPDFFADMLHIFSGKQVERHFDSDISLVLKPLPKVPMLICYWRPEDGLESDLHLFFDVTAENNLKIDSIYLLTVGLVTMFDKMALRHN